MAQAPAGAALAGRGLRSERVRRGWAAVVGKAALRLGCARSNAVRRTRAVAVPRAVGVLGAALGTRP